MKDYLSLFTDFHLFFFITRIVYRKLRNE